MSTVTSREAFLERCKTYTFPRSEEIVAGVASGKSEVRDAAKAEPAATMLAQLQEQIDRVAPYTCPEAEAYRREVTACHAKFAERPQDSYVCWPLIPAPGTGMHVNVYEWESDQSFICGMEPQSQAENVFSRWEWDHPPGVNELQPPWENPAFPNYISWFSSDMNQDDAKSFRHALGHMSAEDRSRWFMAHPASPKWQQWKDDVTGWIYDRVQLGLLPAPNPWVWPMPRNAWCGGFTGASWEASPDHAAEVFILAGERFVGELWCEWLTRHRSQRPRLFNGPHDIPQLVEEFRAASPRPRLLIAQYRSANGVEAAQACRAIEPGLKVFVFSSLLTPVCRRALKERPMVADAVLGTPYSPTEINAVVDRLIGAPGQAQAPASNAALPCPPAANNPSRAHPAMKLDSSVKPPPALEARLKAIEKEIRQIAVQMKDLRAQDDISGLRRLAGRLEDQLLPEVLASVQGQGRELAWAHLNLGMLYRALGRKGEAETALRKADELEPRNLTILLELRHCVGRPDIFIFAESFEADLWVSFLTRKGYNVRGFCPDEIPRLVEELREARPRPTLLIVRGMGGLIGLEAAKACREIEPGLKVLLVTSREELSVLARSPVVIDAIIAPCFALEEFGEVVDRLMSAPRQEPMDLAAQLLAQKQAAKQMMEYLSYHSLNPPPYGPEIFILADNKLEADKWGRSWDLGGYSVRGFGPDEIPRLVEELREARPALLVTRTLGGPDYPGLVAAKNCREIEPGLKVIVATEGGEQPAPTILAKCPVVIDAVVSVPFGFMGLFEVVYDLIGSPKPRPIGPTIVSTWSNSMNQPNGAKQPTNLDDGDEVLVPERFHCRTPQISHARRAGKPSLLSNWAM